MDHSLVVSTKEVPEGSKSFVGLDDPTGVSSNSDLSFRSNVFKQVSSNSIYCELVMCIKVI